MNNAISIDIINLGTPQEKQEVLNVLGKIRHAFPSASGLIIAAFERGTAEPKKYWNSYCFQDFGDETEMESPKIYRTANGLQKTLKTMKKTTRLVGLIGFEKIDYENDSWEERISPLIIGSAFWWHPDVGPRIEKYLKMIGRHFPGNPRQ